MHTTWSVVETTLRFMLDDPNVELGDPDLEPSIDSPLVYGSFAVRGETERVWIEAWHELHTVEAMKAWLVEHGPLMAVFAVHEDFYAYVNGVYHHVAGDLEGAHCASVLGFDNGGEYWIGQNCWGTQWGEGGCFRIAFGERGFDASMWAVELRMGEMMVTERFPLMRRHA